MASKKKQPPQKAIKNNPVIRKNNDIIKIRKNSFPWALAADCFLMLGFLFSNGWAFKLEIEIYFVIGAAIIFFVMMFRKENRQVLFKKISMILIILLAQCLLYFAGLFYGDYPKFALRQFFMNTGALLVFATAYVSLLQYELNTKKLLKMFSFLIVIASLFSIELATSGLLRGILAKIAEILKAQFPSGYGSFETNTRITTVLGNPNVFAPIAVFGMFISLSTCDKMGVRLKDSFISMTFAVISGTTFVLCFSLGTILVYILMIVIYIVVTPKENRGTQLFRHLFCIFISLLGASIVFALGSVSVLPLVSVILISLLSAVFYTRVRPLTLPVLASKHKWIVFAGIIMFCAIVMIGALSFHGSYPMAKGDTFRRAVALRPGTYSILVSTDDANTSSLITVDISSMSYAEAALKTNTQLKKVQISAGQTVEFTVPDAAAVVFTSFTADSDIVISDAVINGNNTSLKLPLKYKILPEFVVNRLQGLWVNDNAIQRFIFFRDGIRLGMKSPVIGLGGGAFEGGLPSVADYYYQTKHVHNEFIQRFIDGGIFGLILFAALPVVIFRRLYKARKNEKLPYALLLACMTMIFLHALIEVDFLMISYRIGASFLFALVAALAGDEIILGKKAKTTLVILFAFTFITAGLLSFGRYIATKMLEKNPNSKSIQNAIVMDPFNSVDYKLSFLLSNSNKTNPYTMNIVEDYLKSLENKVVGADALAQYYLMNIEPDAEKGTKAAELYIRQNRVNTSAWDTIFLIYISFLQSHGADEAAVETVKASINNLYYYLEDLNNTLPIKILPDQDLYSRIQAIQNET